MRTHQLAMRCRRIATFVLAMRCLRIATLRWPCRRRCSRRPIRCSDLLRQKLAKEPTISGGREAPDDEGDDEEGEPN